MAQVLELLNVGVEYCRSASFGIFLWFWRVGEQAITRYCYGFELEGVVSSKFETDQIQQSDLEVEYNTGADGEDEENDVERETGLSPLDNSPLSFFDEFHVIGGVPVFFLGREESRINTTVLLDCEGICDAHQLQTGSKEGDWGISSCRFSQDGTRFATGHLDGSTQVWDADHGRIMHSQKSHSTPVGCVAFRGDSASTILSCDWYGNMVVWDTNSGESITVDPSSHWTDGQFTRTQMLEPCFSDEGLKAVLCLRGFKQTKERMYGADQVVSLIDIVESAPYTGSREGLSEECCFYILDTESTDPSQCGMYHCSIPVWDDFTLTCVCLSPKGHSLLAGFMDLELTEGRVVVWPDYYTGGHLTVTLQGTIGAWSPRMDMAVTWTVPADILPEKGDGGVCFLWEVKDVREKAVDNHSRPLSLKSQQQRGLYHERDSVHPHMLRSSKDGNVLWCDFVIHHDGSLQVVLCSVSDTVHLEFWDTQALVPTRTVTPSIDRLEMSLGKKEMWEKKGVRGKSVRGLQPLTTTLDRSWLGLVDDANSKAYIWNTPHAVEVFRLSLPSELTGRLGEQKDVVLGNKPGKFALVGNDCLIICAPRPPSNDGCRGSLLASLKYVDAQRLDNLQQCPLGHFSHDGKVIGLLHPGSSVIHLWDLDTGKKLPNNLAKPHRESFLNFAISSDGSEVVASTSQMMLLWWRTGMPDITQPITIDHIKGDCTVLGFSRDLNGGRTVVACISSQRLVWWVLSKDFGEEISFSRSEESWMAVKKAVKGHSFQNREAARQATTNGPWKELDMIEVDASKGCTFSSDGREAVTIGKGMVVFAVNLVSRMVVKKYKYSSAPYFMSSLSKRIEASGASIVLGTGADGPGFVKWLPEMPTKNMQVTEIPRNLLRSENGRWILYDELVSPKIKVPLEAQSAGISDVRHRSTNTLWIADIEGAVPPIELSGAGLVPSLLLLMSSDGRRVASITTKYKVKVWSAYAATGLLPDYKLLRTVGRLGERDYVKDILEKMGPSLLNYAEPEGPSMLYHVLLDGRASIRATFLKWALENKVKVSVLQLIYEGQPVPNALELALKQKKPSSAQTIMQFAMLGAAHESDVAIMLQESLVKLGAIYPKILLAALEHKGMLLSLGTAQVPDHLFSGNQEFFATTDIRMQPTMEQLQEIWDTVAHKEQSCTDLLMVPCNAAVIPLPDAAQLSRRGILQNLLLSRADHSVYLSMPMKVIIWYKWKSYGNRMLLDELWHYILLLLFFTTYCILLGQKKNGGIGNEAQVFSILSAALALVNLLRELKQMYSYTSSYGLRGFMFWMTSGWNWMEVTSYVAAIAIPFAKYNMHNDKTALSSIVAIASIMLWGKVLYYARAFYPTGPLVIMIGEIIQDILYFIALAFMVLFGFGVAFFVLYHPLWADESLTHEMDQETVDALKLSFETLGQSLMTVFAFVLGDFDLKVIYSSPVPHVSVSLFVLYMITMMIVLLNLLIAIMGDSFDRIKNSEETQFLRARASAIDDVEGKMSGSLRKKLEQSMLPYVHVVMPLDAQGDGGTQWQGRAHNLHRRMRRDARNHMKHNQMAWKAIEDELKKVNLQLRLLYLSHPGGDANELPDAGPEGNKEMLTTSQPWGSIASLSSSISTTARSSDHLFA